MSRLHFILISLVWIGILSPPKTFAGGEEVVVIYNSRLPVSRTIAEHYAQKRHVPKAQVFGFELTTGEEISRAEFRDALQLPLARKLEATKLWRLGTAEVAGTNGKPVRVEHAVVESKIRYVVLCQGVPLKISRDANLKEAGEESLRPELRRNEAAVDSELACLPLVHRKYLLAGPLINRVYTATNAALLHPTNGILLVTRLDGPSPDIASTLVDKAMQAEADGLWGRAYFDLRNTAEPAMKQGDDWIRAASELSKLMGFETVVDQGGATFPASFPMSHIAFYVGWYTESVDGPLALPNVEFMPGAFAYHLHSFSAGTLAKTNQHWVGPLLARGVTCTMGTVDEPYLSGTPDMAVFTGRFLLLGMTFGEAAYAGQNYLSWQITVVGDPLYRPFGKPPQQQHLELEAARSPLIEWSHLRVVNLNQARGAKLTELMGYLEQIEITKRSAVLSERLADLYAALGKPSSAALTYQQALFLAISPQQRIRLRLTLGDKLIALNREEEAFANFQKFLDENPSYSDKLAICRKLLFLAQNLGKKDQTTKFEEQVKALGGSQSL